MNKVTDIFYAENLLTLVRIPLAIALILVLDDVRMALVILLLAGLSDILDGYIARKMKHKSKLGEFLDPLCDKFFYITVTIAVFFKYQLSWSDVFLFLFRDAMVVLMVVWAWTQKKKIKYHADTTGKITTVIQFVTLGSILGGWMRLVPFFIALTFVSGMMTSIQYRRRLMNHGIRNHH